MLSSAVSLQSVCVVKFEEEIQPVTRDAFHREVSHFCGRGVGPDGGGPRRRGEAGPVPHRRADGSQGVRKTNHIASCRGILFDVNLRVCPNNNSNPHSAHICHNICFRLCYERMNLWEMAESLKSYGVVNAINLDGGGSSTFVINGSLASYPSDHW